MNIIKMLFKKKQTQVAEAPKRREKYILPVSDNKGRTIETDLCCFCMKQEELTGVKKCKHYDLYGYDKCPCFEAAPNQAQRLNELFEARCN